MYSPHPKTIRPGKVARRIRARVGQAGAVLVLLPLAACATPQPPTVLAPTTVRCVDPADIPPEPPQVGDKFNGDAKHDLQILAPNALALRKWGRELRELLLQGCTTAK